MNLGKYVVTRYAVNGTHSLKIALVSDLHGRDPTWCLEQLRAEAPDLIAVPGDIIETICPKYLRGPSMRRSGGGGRKFLERLTAMVYDWDSGTDEQGRVRALRFFREAAKIAPTYYAPGNHDAWLTREDRRLIAQTGTAILENACTVFRRAEVAVTIGGFCSEGGAIWLRKFARKPGSKLLLCHRPELYEPYLKHLDIPLILSGHAHGGQWRLFHRGLFAPGQGIFPKYTKGVYDGRLVVSAGLSNTANVPRICNPCELVIVEWKKDCK